MREVGSGKSFLRPHYMGRGGGIRAMPQVPWPLKPGCTKVFCPQKYTHLAYFIKLGKGGLVILNNEIEQGIGLNLFFWGGVGQMPKAGGYPRKRVSWMPRRKSLKNRALTSRVNNLRPADLKYTL